MESRFATVIRSSPYKTLLEERKAKASINGRERGTKRQKTGKPGVTKPPEARGRGKTCYRGRLGVRGQSADASTSRSSAGASKKQRSRRRPLKATGCCSNNEDEYLCIICGENFYLSRPGECWLQCQMCREWAHEACITGLCYFICSNCESDDSQ